MGIDRKHCGYPRSRIDLYVQDSGDDGQINASSLGTSV